MTTTVNDSAIAAQRQPSHLRHLQCRILELMLACHFEDRTLDTPRNRFVRAALDELATRVDDRDVAHECRALSQVLGRIGASSQVPSRAGLATDQIARNETGDLLMVSLSKMVFEAVIPSEQPGPDRALAADADAFLVRRLFEKAVGNALRYQLQPLGWKIQRGRRLLWPVESSTDGIA